MSLKGKITANAIRGLQERLVKLRTNRLQKKAFNEMADLIRTEVIKTTLEGNATVKGAGKKKKYSESYKSQIRGEKYFWTDSSGRVRSAKGRSKNPHFANKLASKVTLKLSGQMLSQLKTTVNIAKQQITLFFSGQLAKNKALWNEQLGRKVLPDDGEQFSRAVLKPVEKLAKEKYLDKIRKNKK